MTQVTWSNDRGGSGTATGTTSWCVSDIALSSGANVLTVTARDAAGNLGTDVLTVTYTPPPDTTLPVATITGPTSAATFATTTTPLATLSGTASDNVGVTQVTWVNDRGGSGTATGTTSWSVSNIALSSGANVLTVTARDAAGNLGTDVLTVTYTPVESTPPVATITGPTSAATFATTTTPLATLSGTASDNVAVTQVTWVNDRGGSGTATGTTSWSVSNVALSSGANVLTVTARDAAGNLGTDVLTVTYTPPPDTTLPVATITGPTSAVTFATTTTPLASLSGTASDNVGVTQVTWANDRGGSGTATGTTSWSVSNVALSTGANVLTVTARDAAGNLGTDVLTVTYTPPAPSSGLVAAFAFNETPVRSAADASGNANTGTLTNGPVWAAGKNAGALQFDGTNDRVRVADSNSLDLSAGSTFEAWVYSTATPTLGLANDPAEGSRCLSAHRVWRSGPTGGRRDIQRGLLHERDGDRGPRGQHLDAPGSDLRRSATPHVRERHAGRRGGPHREPTSRTTTRCGSAATRSTENTSRAVSTTCASTTAP